MNNPELRPATWLDYKKCLKIIDQTKLPLKLEYIEVESCEQMCAAIFDMLVRGAPLIGICAGFGMVLAAIKQENLAEAYLKLASTRPTAVNLIWALKEMWIEIKAFKDSFYNFNATNADVDPKDTLKASDSQHKEIEIKQINFKNERLNFTQVSSLAEAPESIQEILKLCKIGLDELEELSFDLSKLSSVQLQAFNEKLLAKAIFILEDDIERCKSMGEHGAKLILKQVKDFSADRVFIKKDKETDSKASFIKSTSAANNCLFNLNSENIDQAACQHSGADVNSIDLSKTDNNDLKIQNSVQEKLDASSSVSNFQEQANTLTNKKVSKVKDLSAFVAELSDTKNLTQPVPKLRIMTHCNAGALATGGYGTALGVIRSLYENSALEMVYADETRPRQQGARLTTWELAYDGIPVTLNADTMSAYLMSHDLIDAVVVGSDRITANGDAANKIGTYQLAISAKYHNIPFYVIAPKSTIDLSLESGAQIPIEFRADHEISHINGESCAPLADDPHLKSQLKFTNPAFDVTPYELITAVVTEDGVFEPLVFSKV